MTMEELAALAGVSLSAVSKAFSGSGEVKESTRQKIFDLAKEHGCYYKYIKKDTKNPVIAIICNEVHSLVSQFIPLLQKEIKKRGGNSIIATDNFDSDTRNGFISYFAEHVGVDGIILCNSFGEVCNYNIPVIVIGGTDNRFSSVNITWNRAIEEAILHFMEFGHKKIAYIGEKHTFLKNEIFKQSMEKYGLPINEDFIVLSKKRFEAAGYDGVEFYGAHFRPELYAALLKETGLVCSGWHTGLAALENDFKQTVERNLAVGNWK